MKRVSLREANQNLAKYVAAVETGKRILLTRRGKAVAQLVPVVDAAAEIRKQAAYKRMRARLHRGLNLGGITFARDELYDRTP